MSTPLVEALASCLEVNSDVSLTGLLFEVCKDASVLDIPCLGDEELTKRLTAWRASVLEAPPQQYKCHTCGRNDVRLYRAYSSFLRIEDIRCWLGYHEWLWWDTFTCVCARGGCSKRTMRGR